MMRSVAMSSGPWCRSLKSWFEVMRSVMRPAIAEGLAGHGRIIQQLLRQQRPEQIVVAQFCDQLLAIGELGDLAAAMDEDDAVEAIVDVGVLDQARERRKTRAGRQQHQPLAGQQIVGDQRAGRLAADQDVSPSLISAGARSAGRQPP